MDLDTQIHHLSHKSIETNKDRMTVLADEEKAINIQNFIHRNNFGTEGNSSDLIKTHT